VGEVWIKGGMILENWYGNGSSKHLGMGHDLGCWCYKRPEPPQENFVIKILHYQLQFLSKFSYDSIQCKS
jgi:hypothetical protein